MAEVLSTFQLKQGDSAPEFSLPDAWGKIVSRAETAGKRGLLVIFACNHCPFVIHLADAVGSLAEEISAEGVGTVAINSNDLANYPQDGPEFMKTFAPEHGWKFPYLLDESQDVARAYGAACTPDFFLFDGGGRLFYAGQFDDTRPKKGQEAHGGDLREAVRRMLAGESAMERPYPSSGCNIKWKEGTRPVWWNAGDGGGLS
ncbi:thioredoxin family protein [Luteolibacter sp. SL250]|uniref:thioredoxin family protein n=1 Tax=Luteolibacter sp. SL250 TaxID=2995170 RepID=UPI00226F67FC|nr:thioredoxin family protein [Luteolibacter sp. SL250]WAC19457.1 thioredoxin family protein [Luteolibacter sp. SL250]